MLSRINHSKIAYSIIIVSYNTAKEVEKLCFSLQKSDLKFFKEIIIADNHSSDHIEKVLRVSKQVRLFLNDRNVGFARACNQGARVTKGKYPLFLNLDTIPNPKDIGRMLMFAENHKKSVMGGEVLNVDGSLQPTCGRFPTIFNVVFDRIPLLNLFVQTHLIRQKKYYGKVQEPEWVSGVFMMGPKRMFQKLGHLMKIIFYTLRMCIFVIGQKSGLPSTIFQKQKFTTRIWVNQRKGNHLRHGKFERVFFCFFENTKAFCKLIAGDLFLLLRNFFVLP